MPKMEEEWVIYVLYIANEYYLQNKAQKYFVFVDFNDSFEKSDTNAHSYQCYEFDYQEFESGLHLHQYYELIFISRGRARLQLGANEIFVEAGQLVLIGPGVMHSYSVVDSENGFAGVVVHFGKSVVPAGLLNLPEAKAVKSLLLGAEVGIRIVVEDRERIRFRMLGLIRSRGMFRLARLHVLLDLLARQWNGEVFDDVRDERGLSPRNRARWTSVRGFLDRRCGEDIGRPDAADFLGMEANAFSRFFHEVAGVSFVEYLTRLRIQKAARWLLDRKDFAVTEVALRSGFRTQSAFNRQFKRRLGTTPSAYRNAADLEPLEP